MALNPRPCGKSYATLSDYGGCCLTATAGSYDSNCCDFQYELVRLRTAPYDPWYPVQPVAEKRTSYYGVNDPWAAEQEAERRFRLPPPHIVDRLPANRCNACGKSNCSCGTASNEKSWRETHQAHRPFITPCGSCGGRPDQCRCGANKAPVRDKRLFNAPSSTCPKKGCDCGGDCDEYQYCFAPACSTTRPCKDYSGFGNPPKHYKLVTPPI